MLQKKKKKKKQTQYEWALTQNWSLAGHQGKISSQNLTVDSQSKRIKTQFWGRIYLTADESWKPNQIDINRFRSRALNTYRFESRRFSGIRNLGTHRLRNSKIVLLFRRGDMALNVEDPDLRLTQNHDVSSRVIIKKLSRSDCEIHRKAISTTLCLDAIEIRAKE